MIEPKGIHKVRPCPFCEEFLHVVWGYFDGLNDGDDDDPIHVLACGTCEIYFNYNEGEITPINGIDYE